MTRPTVRMCARCQHTTDKPVLVHEVHAATGPGFNVYACPACAPHYPPMTDPLEILDSAVRRRSRLTLRVYKVDTNGAVTDAGHKVEVHVGGPNEPIPHSTAYPPCACTRCRPSP